ncbi:MAG: hypothetical protein KDK34_02575, partial [Leptospiraceae bacterium]|nr:hypothetical protein [Leptospiraceae bacterium]
PYGESIEFHDGHYGPRHYVAGRDFGDFLVWRKDGYPSYEFAVVIDDIEMRISEVVRGSDLLLSTARQICIYRQLQAPIPEFYHCELVRSADGRRLAKRDSALTIREVLKKISPEELRNRLMQTTSIGGFD